MPTYEYRCKDCGHELEAQQSFDDEPLTECPACGGDLRKRFGAVGISFKGSGFYKTDSRGSSSSSSSSGSSGSSSPSGTNGTSTASEAAGSGSTGTGSGGSDGGAGSTAASSTSSSD